MGVAQEMRATVLQLASKQNFKKRNVVSHDYFLVRNERNGKWCQKNKKASLASQESELGTSHETDNTGGDEK